MKYILFLFCILFFNHSLWAEGGTGSSDDAIVNLDYYKSDFSKTGTGFKSLDQITRGPDPFGKTPTTYSYGTGSGTINWGRQYCSSENLGPCDSQYKCMIARGDWDHIYERCIRAPCPFGTTADYQNSNKCICNEESFAFVDRGNYMQSCPNRCVASENKRYNFFSRSCECNEGYTMAPNGSCNATPPPAQAAAPVNECWRELAEKATACEAEATSAVNRCDSGQDDSLRALQNILVSSRGGATENCERAATASNSGYFQVENTRQACDEQINACKTNCTDATAYLNANKDRAYNACRDRAFQSQINSGPPLPQDRFNPMWDGENRAALETQFQNLLARINTSRTSCETGTAATKRNELSTAMTDMDTTSRNASQCVCQLSPTSADCNKVVGPADCSANPTFPGCSRVAVNCLDPKNTSLKCVCFRNPDSVECKGAQPANVNAKTTNDMDASGFAGPKGTTDTRNSNGEISGMATGSSTEGMNNVGVGKASENYASSDLMDTTPGASGSATGSAGNPGAAAVAPAGGGGGSSSGGGNGSGNVNPFGVAFKNEGGVVNKLGGFFESAKSALGGVFKKGSGNKDSSGDAYSDGGNQNVNYKKFRPRGMVRGIASDSDIAGKYEDIWKVMNKQYKVQDQKDNFIFESK